MCYNQNMKLNIFQGATTYKSAIFMLEKIDKSNVLVDNVVIVPDKFSLLTEKTLLDIFPQGSIFNVRVKSLSSFASELMAEFGLSGEKLISNEESLLLVQQATSEVKKDFRYFKKDNINFCYEISKLISQFKSSSVDFDGLNQNAQGVVGAKYHDLALIYQRYQQLLEGRLDGNERMKLLGGNVLGSDVLSNKRLYFAFFDAFTKEAFDFISCLFQKAQEISVSVACPQSIGNEYIYEKDIAYKFENLASSLGGEYEVFSTNKGLTKQQKAIVQGLYSYEQVKEDNNGYYNIYGAPSVAMEVESVAKLIRYQTYCGKKYRDIQVAVGSLAKYENQIASVFARYDIPFFIDSSVTADQTILGNFVLQVLSTVVSGYGKDNLTDLFANVLLSDHQAIKDIEKFDVDGRARYKKYFEKVCPLAQEFSALENATTCEEFSSIILSLLSLTEEKFASVMQKLQEEEDHKYYNINSQMADIIKESVDMISRHSEKEIEIGEYLKKLKLILSFKQVSSVPAYLDSVMVADATTSAFEESEILIVMGGEELPVSAGDNGFLSDEELEINFAQKPIEPTIRMINRRNRFKLFNLLSLAKDNLYLFYQLANEEGKKNELPLYAKSLNIIFSQSVNNARGVFFANNPTDEKWAMLVSGVKEKEQDFARLTKKEDLKNGEEIMLGDGRAKVTQLENYFSCPFKHFATFGLKLKEARREFGPRDSGNVCHKMAEIFVKNIIMKDLLQQTDIKKFVDKNIEKVLKDEGVWERIENLDEKNALIGFLKKQCNSLLGDIVKENAQSKFSPKWIEMKFDDMKLCGKYTVVGRVDRIDEYGDYLRVLDYKTGSTGNLLKQLYYGEKLQLFLYQKILADKYKKKEGGVFYFNAKFDYSKLEQEDNVILKGLIDDEEELILATDKDVEDAGKSKITQMKKTSKGYSGAAIAPVKLSKLGQYAFDCAQQGAEEIAQGHICPKPCNGACRYCPYGALCGYEFEKGVRKNNDKVEFEQKED